MNVKISYNTLVYAGENIADGIRRKKGYSCQNLAMMV